MATTTYSFSDVSLVLSHPSVGKCTITGEGVGSVTVSRANDLTQHDVAADGSVMVSCRRCGMLFWISKGSDDTVIVSRRRDDGE